MANEHITITGFVVPVDWDEHGTVVVISIVTNSFEKYILADDKKGKELVNFIDEEVRVEGVVTGEDLAGNKIIEIMNYKVL